MKYGRNKSIGKEGPVLIISEVCTFAGTQALKIKISIRISLKSALIEFNVNLHSLGKRQNSWYFCSNKFRLTNSFLTESVNLTKKITWNVRIISLA